MEMNVINTKSALSSLDGELFQPYLPGLKPGFPVSVPGDMLDTPASVEGFVEELILKTNQQLPINIDALLRICGATTTSHYVGGDMLGRIRQVRGQNYFIVDLNSNQPKRELAFTKAHELGHLILNYSGYPISNYSELIGLEDINFGSGEFWRKSDLKDRIESFCDYFARAVLTPRLLLVPRFQDCHGWPFDSVADHDRYELKPELKKIFADSQLPPHDFLRRLEEANLWKEDYSLIKGLLFKDLRERGAL